jgi:hypothetical protein
MRWLEFVDFVEDTGFGGNCQRILRVRHCDRFARHSNCKAGIFGLVEMKMQAIKWQKILMVLSYYNAINYFYKHVEINPQLTYSWRIYSP